MLVDYRLSPRAQCPAYIDDAAAAVAWTIRHISGMEAIPETCSCRAFRGRIT